MIAHDAALPRRGPARAVPGRRWGRAWRGAVNSPVRAAAAAVLAALVAAAVLAPAIAPYNPLTITVADRLTGPSARHLLGTDEVGRDLLSNILYAGRVSLLVGSGATAVGMVLAVPLGLVAGLRGGLADDLIMRFTDGLLAIPGILLALAIVASFGTSLRTLMIGVGCTLIPATVRIVRAGVLVERAKDYVVAAHALGSREARILLRHVFPNVRSAVLIQGTLGMTFAILTEAFMSFVGLGVQPPASSLGTLLASGYGFIRLAPWYVTFPGIAIFMLVWSLNVLGDAFRDSLDPRLRRF